MREYVVEYETPEGRHACEWFSVFSTAVLAQEIANIEGYILRITFIS